ncbi:hypothetical protein D5F01_LYC24187 [Larimichthys crocea]|uniref:Uncharacterized protein n=1 Tax=Larimichthys crocea TaxID=215358 RepID=A0A6G0HFD7_LARCR|nr:hypothetical protein D5F01_LYC24187 [Larimichthys crocea]
MTKPKSNGICPICGKTLQLVAKHLRETHAVRNPTERSILNNLATGRTVHKDLTQAEIERRRAGIKRDTAIAALARLQASNPQPAMVSRLDLEDPGEGSSTSHPQRCQNPGCRRERKEEAAKIKRLKRRIAGLKAALRWPQPLPREEPPQAQQPRPREHSSPRVSTSANGGPSHLPPPPPKMKRRKSSSSSSPPPPAHTPSSSSSKSLPRGGWLYPQMLPLRRPTVLRPPKKGQIQKHLSRGSCHACGFRRIGGVSEMD